MPPALHSWAGERRRSVSLRAVQVVFRSAAAPGSHRHSWRGGRCLGGCHRPRGKGLRPHLSGASLAGGAKRSLCGWLAEGAGRLPVECVPRPWSPAHAPPPARAVGRSGAPPTAVRLERVPPAVRAGACAGAQAAGGNVLPRLRRQCRGQRADPAAAVGAAGEGAPL